MRIFFTADTHFGHKNVVAYDESPFGSIRERDEAIITRWNQKVGPEDTVYHLGDFALGSEQYAGAIASRLNGKIYLIKGNHEKVALSESVVWRFESIEGYREEHVNGNLFVMFHYPIHEWNRCHRGSFMLHGHTHRNDDYDPRFRRMNVGIMNCGYAPVSAKEVTTHLLSKEPYPHHGRAHSV